MTLVGNLVLSGSKVVYHQRLHHMPKYIEWLLGVMYLVEGKTPEEYAQQESLLWEFILLGLAFPHSVGINCVNFLPVDDSPFFLLHSVGYPVLGSPTRPLQKSSSSCIWG
ncbi:hypothetical protein DSO57_1010342 [Entomophthora muscae]|uniref:Uncharacterized protein n=1 Tax=Entomophthora muscae TaxID=34485 RepID=A0ACC2UG20_9FUNG|nr:hypothetical protein DSO57_1010342 [Entomophthora muscae]